MAVPWTILTTCDGEDIAQPSQAQFADAARELYDDYIAGMRESDAEHPNATTRYGTDDGPIFVIDAYR